VTTQRTPPPATSFETPPPPTSPPGADQLCSARSPDPPPHRHLEAGQGDARNQVGFLHGICSSAQPHPVSLPTPRHAQRDREKGEERRWREEVIRRGSRSPSPRLEPAAVPPHEECPRRLLGLGVQCGHRHRP
jgi:hypothetical protein